MFCPICNIDNPVHAVACRTCGVSLDDENGAFDDALRAGTVLRAGHFTVGHVLGKGGFGITYLGSDTRARRAIAIKELFPFGSSRRGNAVLPRGFVGGEYRDAVRQFLDEAHTLLRFNHPQIVDVHTVFEENNTVYMVMEYLQGKTLLQLLTEQRTLPEARAIEYTMQVGGALDAMHQCSLLHRDVKPDNVIVTDEGRVVLFDFGTVRTFSSGQTSRMTAQLTPGYAPLEQYGRNARFGRYTDIYSLGAMLYHLLTGEMPPPATDRAGGEELRPPAHINPSVSHATSQAVLWAMEMKIDARPQSVQEFIEALRLAAHAALRASHSASVTIAPPLAPVPTPEFSPACEGRRERFTKALQKTVPTAVTDACEQVRVAQSLVQWPKQCACCGGNSETFMMIQAPAGESAPYRGWSPHVDVRQWHVPYCTKCVLHMESHRDARNSGWRLGTGVATAMLLGVGFHGTQSPALVGAILVTGLGLPYHRFAMRGAVKAMKPTCVWMQAAVEFGGWDEQGIFFNFHNSDYAAEFRELNSPILKP